MPGSVTLTLTSGSGLEGNFTIFCESADPGNEIATNVSSASLAAGYCTNTICDQYVIKSNTNDCVNQIVVYPFGPPPTQTPGPVTPTPTPAALPTLNNGFRLQMGTYTFGSTVFNGFHRGTLFGCPSSLGIGTGVTPTSTQIPLPGTDCYYTSIFGANIEKGYGIGGVGNVSSLAITQFLLDTNTGTATMGLINGNTVGNPGSGTLSGTIQGDNLTSGTWSCTYSPGSTYTDNNGAGTNYTPESIGTLTISGLTLTSGVTYNINT